jgi:hypothetical protein
VARPVAVLAGVTVSLVVALAGCASEPQEDYCDALESEKQALSDLSAGSAEPREGVVTETIGVFERLREEAPADVQDEWDVYLTAWRGLETALDEAGADETLFEDGSRPEGMSREHYRAISQAAVELRSTEVVEAAAGIEQQALDVCSIDLGGSPPVG